MTVERSVTEATALHEPVSPALPAVSPPPNFDRVARLYRWVEYLCLGPLLERTRNHFLPQLVSCRRALLLGDGDGRFTAALLREAPALRADAVDGSKAMLRLLRQRCLRDGTASRLRTSQTSVLLAQPYPATDLIVTHFLLDCLMQAEVEHLAQQLAAALRPGTLWLVSDFGSPRNPLARKAAAVYVRLLYAVFRVLTGLRPQHLPDPQAALRTAGFTQFSRRERLGGLLYTELWRLGIGVAAQVSIPNGVQQVQRRHEITQLAPAEKHQPESEI